MRQLKKKDKQLSFQEMQSGLEKLKEEKKIVEPELKSVDAEKKINNFGLKVQIGKPNG